MSEVLSEDEIDVLLTIASGNKLKNLFLKLGLKKRKIARKIKKKYNKLTNKVILQDANEFCFNLYGPPLSFEDEEIADRRGYTLFKWRHIDFIIEYDNCPKCGSFQGLNYMSIDEYNKTPGYNGIYMSWFRYSKKKPCKKCGKKIKPVIKYYIRGNESRYNKIETIQLLEKWNLSQEGYRFPLFHASDSTIQTKNKKLILYWDSFQSEKVKGLESCPEDLFCAIIQHSTIKELISMLKGKKKIPVFNGHDFSYAYNLEPYKGKKLQPYDFGPKFINKSVSDFLFGRKSRKK